MARQKELIRQANIRRDAIEEGIEKGKIEIAKNMLKKNMPLSDIVELTGLTKEEIQKLKY